MYKYQRKRDDNSTYGGRISDRELETELEFPSDLYLLSVCACIE